MEGLRIKIEGHGFPGRPDLRRRAWKRRLNRFYAKLVERFHESAGALLDVGCGDGSFMSYMSALGWDVFGVETNKDIVNDISEEVRRKIRFVAMGLDEARFEDDLFDVVTLWNVFEHISDSDNLLNTIKKILKANGLLVMQVPNIESLEARIFKANWVHLDPPRHLHHFSPATLTSVLSKNNFKIKAINYHSPIDKSYRGSFENLLKAKLQMPINQYLFHNITYKIVLDLIFTPLTIIGNVVRRGTFITIACVNEK